MKKTAILFMMALLFLMLQSFQSCGEELVTICVENDSEDTLFCTSRPTHVFGDLLDAFEGGRSSFEWVEIGPKVKAGVFHDLVEDKESISWKVWIVNKRDMKDMTIAILIDMNLLDSLCSMAKVFSYEDLKKNNFCIKVY